MIISSPMLTGDCSFLFSTDAGDLVQRCWQGRRHRAVAEHVNIQKTRGETTTCSMVEKHDTMEDLFVPNKGVGWKRSHSDDDDQKLFLTVETTIDRIPDHRIIKIQNDS